MATVGSSIESTFNQALGDALAEVNARWRHDLSVIHIEETQLLAGSGNAGKRPDILIQESTTPPLVIETSYSPSDAENDAIERLGKETVLGNVSILSAFAVYVPSHFRDKNRAQIESSLRSGEPVYYAIFQSQSEDNDAVEVRRWPKSGWIEGTVADLSDLLSVAVLPREIVEAVAKEIADQINNAAQGLEHTLSSSHQAQIAKLLNQSSSTEGLRTTMVLWLNALLTQHRLALLGVPEAEQLIFSSSHTPDPVIQADQWRNLLTQNWLAIFEPALKVIETAGSFDPGQTSMALKLLIRAVQRIEIARLGLYINLGAELFPLLSSDRKEAAAFYTQPGTAELLASLTIQRNYIHQNEWASDQLFLDKTVGDLACGTGTLLRASYRRIVRLHEEAGGSMDTVAKLHKDAMEHGIVGTDISPIAAHLTASSLATLGSGEPYGETRIGWVKVGGEDAATGSLEYLRRDELGDLLSELGGRSSGMEHSEVPVAVLDETLDWVLMNPPYSRTRGGQSTFDIGGLTESERKACQKRWGEMIKGLPVKKTAGMAASFLQIAKNKVKRGGRIGFVLPRTAALAESWQSTREMMLNEFEDILIVGVEAGLAIGSDAMSSETHMEEMLLVASRRQETRKENSVEDSSLDPCHIFTVTLRAAPTRSGEAGEIGRAINNGLSKLKEANTLQLLYIGDEEIGYIDKAEVSPKGLPWSPVGVVSPDLVRASTALTQGRLHVLDFSQEISLPMVKLGQLVEVGPTHHLLGFPRTGDPIGAFEFHPITDRRDLIWRDLSLWAARSEQQRSLVVDPTHKGTPKSGDANDLLTKIRKTKGRCHYARNMRWTSQSLLAATTTNPVLGGRSWVTLIHEDTRVLSALSLWCNSTLGLTLHWTQGQRTQSGRSTIQINGIKKIPFPKLDQLSEIKLDRAQQLFNEISKLKLQPACQALSDPLRHKIDSAVIELLDLPVQAEHAVGDLRRLWCTEPSVHGGNKRALSLLSDDG